MRRGLPVIAGLLISFGLATPANAQWEEAFTARADTGAALAAELASRVEIRRTEYGVPHILAEDLRSAAFALAWVQIEDHGPGVIRGVATARGRMALVQGPGRIDADARNRRRHARAIETFQLLSRDTRDVYEGFAEGMNHFIRVHRGDTVGRGAELDPWMEPDFTAYDVLTRDIRWPSEAVMDRFLARILADPDDPGLAPAEAFLQIDDAHPDEPGRWVLVEQEDENTGSNALALAPERTTGGNAILLRNPHLSWTAGYYEAHVRVPGKLDFYGDFRIGGPFTVIGGFNPALGFATTNNNTRSHEFYAFRMDPERPDHMLLDGTSVPLRREEVQVEYRTGDAIATDTREFWTSHLGPVVHRGDGLVYIYRPALDGEFRAGEQWLEMMKAMSLDEWKDAMRIGARATSNFTYADRDGNILYVWVSAAPLLPHADGGDTLAVPASRTSEVWTRLAPFDSLPQLLNPPGGYVRNENDSPHFTNMHAMLDPDRYSFWVEEPRLRLRSQHGLELLHNDRRFSLDDVVEIKHSMGMLLADRVKDDLVAAVRAAAPTGEVAEAVEFLAGWDNTVAAESRGGVLFEAWWDRYRQLVDSDSLYVEDWDIERPMTTPYGVGNPAAAVEAFARAVPEVRERWGGWDIAWGDVHRVRRGDVDVPVGGCGGALGCFRVLNFSTASDGRRYVNGGDGWVIAVEFGADRPRARTVLAYGQSTDPESPFHANQAELFASNGMKEVPWTEAEIEAHLLVRYRPGERWSVPGR